VAHTTNQVVRSRGAILHGHDFDGVGLVLRPQDEMVSGNLHVLDGTATVLENSVHIELALAIGLEGIVVTIDEDVSAGKETGIHAHALAAIHFDYDEALPVFAVAHDFGLQFFQKNLLEFDNFFDVHAGNERAGGGNRCVSQENVLKFIVAGRQDGSALVDFGGIEQVEDGKMLNG